MSTVIKARDTGPLLPRLATVDLADHLGEARAVIAEARAQAARILAEARAEAARTRQSSGEAGYQEGYRRGYEEGLAGGHQAAREESLRRFDEQQTGLVSSMERAIGDFEAIKEGLAIAARSDLLEFAVSLARRMTFSIGRLHRESAAENLQRALRLVGSKTDVLVRVHPDDLAAMETFAASLVEKVRGLRSVKLREDETLAPGGCVVESASGEVDASLETQMEELVSLLLGKKANHG